MMFYLDVFLGFPFFLFCHHDGKNKLKLFIRRYGRKVIGSILLAGCEILALNFEGSDQMMIRRIWTKNLNLVPTMWHLIEQNHQH